MGIGHLTVTHEAAGSSPVVGSGNSEPRIPDILSRSVLPGKGSSNLR